MKPKSDEANQRLIAMTNREDRSIARGARDGAAEDASLRTGQL
jgi:hypothetical protein